MNKNRIESEAGPDWYQELSPNQIRTVEDLKQCLVKDLQDHTIINTQENVASLGLVERPDHTIVEKAIKLSKRCPIEFLLILYQLKNPKRKHYSLNDRLLLSAVVHLSMKDTLRELHVRVPSPPPLVPIPHKVRKEKKKRIKYDSPYLVPYTFRPEERTFKGIYFNKHRQHPESIYFDYIPAMRKEISVGKKPEDYPATSVKEKEIIEELKLTQQLYNDTHGCSNIKLIKPRQFASCADIEKRNIKFPPVKTRKFVKEYQAPAPSSPVAVSIQVQVTTQYESNEPVAKQCRFSIDYKEILKDEPVRSCEYEESFGRPGEIRPKATNSCPCAKAFVKSQDVKNEGTRAGCCSSFAQTIQSIKATQVDLDLCQSKKSLSQSDKNKSKSECFLACTSPKVENLSEIKDLDDFIIKPEEIKQTVKEDTSLEKDTCDCKAEVIKNLEESKCTCALCIEGRNRENATYVISGVRKTPSGQEIPIISGIRGETYCDCMKNYQQQIDKLEKYRQRLQLRKNLISEDDKYIIGGVVNTPQGPAYIITGVRPYPECKCAKQAKEEEENKQQLARLAQIPKGRIKYIIAGTRELSKENVFLISSAIPMDECSCMKLLANYETQHKSCLEMYEDYMKQLEEDVREYMESLNYENEEMLKSEDDLLEPEPENEEQEENTVVHEETLELQLQGEIDEEEHHNVDDELYEKSELVSDTEKQPETAESSKNDEIQSEVKETKNVQDIMRESIEKMDYEMDVEISVTKPSTAATLKRFYISKTFPRRFKDQQVMLLKVLQVMAEDGYPIAKLPQCHKLLHFKLWLQMRQKVSWSLEDKEKLILRSITKWKHLDYKTPVKVPKLDITMDEARAFTWQNYATVKKMATDEMENKYRIMKREQVKMTRNFFPTVNIYEFPSVTFRDCYFAYCAAKEEEIHPFRIWKPHERRNFHKRQSCLCKR